MFLDYMCSAFVIIYASLGQSCFLSHLAPDLMICSQSVLSLVSTPLCLHTTRWHLTRRSSSHRHQPRLRPITAFGNATIGQRYALEATRDNRGGRPCDGSLASSPSRQSAFSRYDTCSSSVISKAFQGRKETTKLSIVNLISLSPELVR